MSSWKLLVQQMSRNGSHKNVSTTDSRGYSVLLVMEISLSGSYRYCSTKDSRGDDEVLGSSTEWAGTLDMMTKTAEVDET